MKDLQDIVHELKDKGVALKATQQPIDTSTAMGKMFFDMLGVFAIGILQRRHVVMDTASQYRAIIRAHPVVHADVSSRTAKAFNKGLRAAVKRLTRTSSLFPGWLRREQASRN